MVKLSNDGRQLYFGPTIDTSKTTSSFHYASDAEVNGMVKKLNEIYFKGKELGFKKVLLTIVPNTVSILDPHYNGYRYNNLVARIQGSPELKLPFIDLVPDFTRLKNVVYDKSDSHWSWRGADLWMDKFTVEAQMTSQ